MSRFQGRYCWFSCPKNILQEILDTRSILIHEIKSGQLPLKYTLKTVWKVRVAGQCQAMKVWEQTTSQAWTGLSWTLTTSNAKPENTKPKNIQWNEKESVSQWASQISMHQGGDIHIQSIWGWQGGGFVLRIVIFLLAAVTPHRAQSFDASLCHKGFSTAYCLPSSQNSRRKPAVTFPPPLLHHIHPWSVLLKTSWKYAINSNLRHAFRAFKNNLFKAKHQRKSKVTEV